MTSLIWPLTSTPVSGSASSSRPDRTSSRPPQNGRLRRQRRQAARAAWRRWRRWAPGGVDAGGAGSVAGEEKRGGSPAAFGAEPASSVVIRSAAPAEAEAEIRQGERAGRGQPGVLVEVVDGDRVGLLAEAARGAGRARVLGQRPRVQANTDVGKCRHAAGLPARVDDQVVRARRGSGVARGEPQGDRPDRHRLAQVGQLRPVDGGHDDRLRPLGVADLAAELLESGTGELAGGDRVLLAGDGDAGRDRALRGQPDKNAGDRDDRHGDDGESPPPDLPWYVKSARTALARHWPTFQ